MSTVEISSVDWWKIALVFIGLIILAIISAYNRTLRMVSRPPMFMFGGSSAGDHAPSDLFEPTNMNSSRLF